MAYKKKVYKKKYTKKSKPASSATATANKALAIAKSLQKKVEYKHHDLVFAADEDVDPSGTTLPLLEAISQGTSNATRVGTEITVARLRGEINVAMNAPETAPGTFYYRLMLVRGIRDNNLVPTMGTSVSAERGVLENNVPYASPLILAKKSDNNMRDTKILYDKTFPLTPGQMTSRIHRWNFKLGWKTQYKEGDTSVENGGLYFLICSDTTGGNIIHRVNLRTTFSEL